jgi:hypothetical protein
MKKIFSIIFILCFFSSCGNNEQSLTKESKQVPTTIVQETTEKQPWTNADGSPNPINGEEYLGMLMYQLDLTQEDLDSAPKEFINTINEFCDDDIIKINIIECKGSDVYTLEITSDEKIQDLKNIFRKMKNIIAVPYKTRSGAVTYTISYQTAQKQSNLISCMVQFSYFEIPDVPNIAFGVDEANYETIKPAIQKFNKYFDENAVLVQ